MPDLTDELQQVADSAAYQARPMAVTDVIRRGDRRRHRMIAQRSLGGLSVAGLSAAVFLTGATSSAPSATSASATHGVITLNEQSASAAGNTKVVVRYRDEPRGRIELLGGTYAIKTAKNVHRPILMFTLVLAPVKVKGKKPVSTTIGVSIVLRSRDKHIFTGKLPNFATPHSTRWTLTSGSQLTAAVANLVKPGTKNSAQEIDSLVRTGLILY